MGDKLTVNPWLGMWVRPRETIRAIIQYRTSYLLPLLYWIYGLPILLQVAQNMSLGDRTSLEAILIGAAIGSVIMGWIGINLGSALFHWTGKWIGGTGSYQEIRTALAWSSVPSLANIILWAIQLVTFGNRLFTFTFVETQFIGAELAVVFLTSLAQIVITVWGIIILLKALGEAQGFSAWKALLNVVLPIVIIFVGIRLLTWLFFLFSSGVH